MGQLLYCRLLIEDFGTDEVSDGLFTEVSADRMIFKETEIQGAFVIELEKHQDSRGFFARAWCRSEFEDHGCDGNLVQANISYNRR